MKKVKSKSILRISLAFIYIIIAILLVAAMILTAIRFNQNSTWFDEAIEIITKANIVLFYPISCQ